VSEHFDWRKHLVVHPAADLFPLMSEAELRELAADIKKSGLAASIAVWYPADALLAKTKPKGMLIDGRNRLDALASVGLLGVNDKGELTTPLWGHESGWLSECTGFLLEECFYGGDPYAIALSLNVHRRHLSAEQRRELIAKVLKATPEKSNNQIANQVKADDKTVGRVRADLESRSEIPNVDARTDTKGRKQPAKRKQSNPEEVHERSKRRAEKKGAAIRATLEQKPEPSPEASAEARRAYYIEHEADEGQGEREFANKKEEHERVRSALMLYVGTAIDMSKEFATGLRRLPSAKTPKMVDAVRRAAEAWSKLAQELESEPAPKARAA
jgi:hypothetical protein